MKLNKKYTVLWIIWITAFGVIEFAALKDKKQGRSLSSHVWKLIGTKTKGRNWENWIFRIALAGGFIWIVPHFFTAGW